MGEEVVALEKWSFKIKRLLDKNTTFPLTPLKCSAPQAKSTISASVLRRCLGLERSRRNSLGGSWFHFFARVVLGMRSTDVISHSLICIFQLENNWINTIKYEVTYICENSSWRFCGLAACGYTRIWGEDLDEDVTERAQSKGLLLPLVELVHPQLQASGDRTGSSLYQCLYQWKLCHSSDITLNLRHLLFNRYFIQERADSEIVPGTVSFIFYRTILCWMPLEVWK